MRISVEDFVSGPDGEMDWKVWNRDDVLNDDVTGITVAR
jgi:hypothetical protein